MSAIILPDLLAEYEDGAQEKLGVQKLLKKYSNYTLHIIDEWLIQVPSKDELHFLFELIERRYDTGAMIFCTQFKTEDWHSRPLHSEWSWRGVYVVHSKRSIVADETHQQVIGNYKNE